MSSEFDEDRSPNQIRGRPFAPGNPGRPPGAKNKTTQLAAGLLAEAAPEIMRVVVERAKTGDPAICKTSYPTSFRNSARWSLNCLSSMGRPTPRP